MLKGRGQTFYHLLWLYKPPDVFNERQLTPSKYLKLFCTWLKAAFNMKSRHMQVEVLKLKTFKEEKKAKEKIESAH